MHKNLLFFEINETLLNLSTWAEQNEIERIGLPDHYIVGKQRHDKDNPAPALDLKLYAS